MKRVFLIAFMLGLVSTGLAQTSKTGTSGQGECKLKLAQAPSIRGVRLGMRVNEVLAVLTGGERNGMLQAQLSQPRFGLVTATVFPEHYATKEKLAGIYRVDFSLLDGEVIFYSLTYNGPEWDSVEQFASKVAATLNLPGVQSWTQNLYAKSLACDGFEVSAGSENLARPSIKVRNVEKDANRIVRGREEAVKDEARRAFKP